MQSDAAVVAEHNYRCRCFVVVPLLPQWVFLGGLPTMPTAAAVAMVGYFRSQLPLWAPQNIEYSEIYSVRP